MQKIEYVGTFKVIHNIPDYTDKEREEKKKEIVRNLYYNYKYNSKKSIDTKVK